jgi:8-oxo-dGTP diphosphatase
VTQSINLPDRSEANTSPGKLGKPQTEVVSIYGNRLRLRVCGLFREGNRLLMVRHRGLGPANTFWSPPGGGVEFGETAPSALIREFAEETGLDVVIGELLFVNEFVAPPLHAVELFFVVQCIGGSIRQGIDPEMSPDDQIIDEVRFMGFDEIKEQSPEKIHALFRYCSSLEDVFQLRGYLHY